MSIVKRGVAFNKEANFYITDATDLVSYIQSRTEYTPMALTALGKATMISGVMGLSQKVEGKTTTLINGSGPIGSIIVTSKSNGELKSRCTNPLAVCEPGESVIGSMGVLRVVRDVGLRDAFTSEVELQPASIEANYTYYFSVSEQIPTALTSEIIYGEDTKVKKAGCLIVQLLPNASEETISKVESLFTEDLSIAKKLENQTEEEILEGLFGDDFKLLGESNMEFKCDCSKEKFVNAIQMLSPDEIIEIKQDKEIEVVCDFCYKKYDIDTKEL